MSYELMIDPRIEIIGIIEYFSDPLSSDKLIETIRNPIEREYQNSMISYFEKYKEHPALLFYKTLKQNGFGSETAIRLLLYHSQIPYLFSQPVIQNQKHLEWIQLLRAWVEETKYGHFLENNQLVINQIQDMAESQISQTPICDLIEIFFGDSRKSYHIHPSSFKTGNYNVFLPNQGLAIVLGYPLFNENTILSRVLHEFSYGFIRPTVDLNWSLFQQFESIFKDFSKTILPGKTLSKREVIYELITQSVLSILSPSVMEKSSIIYSLTTLIEQEYQHHRNHYPNFSSFIPRIIELLRELIH